MIVVAKLVEGVLSRFGLSSIIAYTPTRLHAYTATGVVLGPVLGIAEASTESQLFLGIGILVLFFLAGLDEIDIPGFVATFCGRYFVAAVLSVVVSLLVALIVTSDLLDLPFALGLGFSIGEHHDLTALNVLILLAKILGFVVVTWVLSAKLLPPAILFLRRYVVVDDGMVAGIVSMPKVRSVPGTTRTLRDLLRTRVPHACPDELIVDVMDRMTSSSMTVIPVMDRDSGRFLGTLATHDVLDLVALMDEIKEEEKAMGAATETADA